MSMFDNTELRTILNNLELGRKYYDWEIVDRAITRLANHVMENSNDPSRNH